MLVLLLALPAVTGAQIGGECRSGFVPGQLTVSFHDGTGKRQMARIHRRVGATVIRRFRDGRLGALVRVEKGRERRAMRRYWRYDAVKRAERVGYVCFEG